MGARQEQRRGVRQVSAGEHVRLGPRPEPGGGGEHHRVRSTIVASRLSTAVTTDATTNMQASNLRGRPAAARAIEAPQARNSPSSSHSWARTSTAARKNRSPGPVARPQHGRGRARSPDADDHHRGRDRDDRLRPAPRRITAQANVASSSMADTASASGVLTARSYPGRVIHRARGSSRPPRLQRAPPSRGWTTSIVSPGGWAAGEQMSPRTAVPPLHSRTSETRRRTWPGRVRPGPNPGSGAHPVPQGRRVPPGDALKWRLSLWEVFSALWGCCRFTCFVRPGGSTLGRMKTGP